MKTGIHNQNKLAILGGSPVRAKPFPNFPVIGQEEVDAVTDVVKTGKLSMFDLDFLGGDKVQTFEKNFADYNNVKYAISVNSGTAALHVAVAAANIGPGNEVIVPPYTFTATASSVLMNNAIPVFVDIDSKTYNLDHEKIEKSLTKRTKAIIPVHLFGHPAEMDAILDIAHDHDLIIIEDCAQAPGAEYRCNKVGSLGDLGAFSFQRTKNMTTGEGGMITTNNDDLAHRCRLIRNHGESHVKGKPREYIANILGWNYRMTEMEASIGIEQLKKLDKFNQVRIENSHYLNKQLADYSCYLTPEYPAHLKHVFGHYAMKLDLNFFGVSKKIINNALEAEGIPVWAGYPHPLYENPIFNEKIVYGNMGCPFTCNFYRHNIDYRTCPCPVTEDICKSVFGLGIIRPPATFDDMDDVINAMIKIVDNRKELKKIDM